MRKSFASLIAAIGVLYILSSNAVFAGLVCYGTETAISDDGKYILVRIDPDLSLDEELASVVGGAREDEIQAKIRAVRTTYPESGLYLNDGSTEPLWTYDGDWCAYGPVIAADGQHVIFPDLYTSGDEEYRSVRFTRRGQLLRRYCDVDLIPQYMIKWLFNGCSPPRWVKTSFDPQTLTYAIRTNQGEEFIVDVTDGRIIAIRSPFTTIYVAVVAALSAILALAFQWHRRKPANP